MLGRPWRTVVLPTPQADFDGTATVGVRSAESYLRRVLSIKGDPIASDSTRPLTSVREGDGIRVEFDKDEQFEIP